MGIVSAENENYGRVLEEGGRYGALEGLVNHDVVVSQSEQGWG